MKTTNQLLDLLALTQIDHLTFEGKSESVGSPNVFGGQVLAQALNAAYQTIAEERLCHSMHAYFILPGDLEKPIHYKVQKVRDGGSFTTRYVSAEQDGKSIFVLAASFQIKEEGYEYQVEMPDAPRPETLMSLEDIYNQAKAFLPQKLANYLGRERPVTFKPSVLPDLFERKNMPPYQNTWFRLNDISEEISVRQFQQVLAYTSDYNLLTTALHPHASVAHAGNTMLASLDHALWFHQIPERYSDWFLFHIDVESLSNARGLVSGKIFSSDGKLIASVAQEGLIRKQIKKK